MAVTGQDITEANEAAGEKPLRVLFISSQWPTPENPAIAPFIPRAINALRHVGVTVDVLLYEGGWSPGRYRRAVGNMRQMLRENSYDVVHAYFGQCGLVARMQNQAAVVITYGGSDVEGSPVFRGRQRYKNYLLIGVSRMMALLADEVIVVADNLGRKLPRRDYHVIPTPVELDKFQPGDQVMARRKLNLPLDKKLALFAANPANTRKRYDLAKQAVDIAGRTLDVELVVATGRPPDEIPLYMQACDALLLTSTNEGSPNVVREALACDLPVVSTDVGDVRERIGRLESCAVCADDSPEAIAQALVRVLTLPQRPKLSDEVAGQAFAVAGRKVVAVYRKALARKGR